jgi:hypothetical protein
MTTISVLTLYLALYQAANIATALCQYSIVHKCTSHYDRLLKFPLCQHCAVSLQCVRLEYIHSVSSSNTLCVVKCY